MLFEERLVPYDEEHIVLRLHFCRSLYLCVVSINDYVVIILGFLMCKIGGSTLDHALMIS